MNNQFDETQLELAAEKLMVAAAGLDKLVEVYKREPYLHGECAQLKDLLIISSNDLAGLIESNAGDLVALEANFMSIDSIMTAVDAIYDSMPALNATA
ncbi:hypothetical protein ACYPKM_00730 [Pseudomonas aeruginosa]